MSDFEEWARANKLSLSTNENGRVYSATRVHNTRRVITQELRTEAGSDYGRFYFQELTHDAVRIRGPVWIDNDVDTWNTVMWGDPY